MLHTISSVIFLYWSKVCSIKDDRHSCSYKTNKEWILRVTARVCSGQIAWTHGCNIPREATIVHFIKLIQAGKCHSEMKHEMSMKRRCYGRELQYQILTFGIDECLMNVWVEVKTSIRFKFPIWFDWSFIRIWHICHFKLPLPKT